VGVYIGSSAVKEDGVRRISVEMAMAYMMAF
jgi:hypothetical protein